jgi:predicted nucleic acid-binding protein
VSGQLIELAGLLYVCQVGELELLYSARSARDYDARRSQLHSNFRTAAAPSDVFERALRLQRDLAHHHGKWHRIPIPDLLIAETALQHVLGVVHVDGDFERIAEVRPLVVRRLG